MNTPNTIIITFTPVGAVPAWVREEMVRAVRRAVNAWLYAR